MPRQIQLPEIKLRGYVGHRAPSTSAADTTWRLCLCTELLNVNDCHGGSEATYRKSAKQEPEPLPQGGPGFIQLVVRLEPTTQG